MASMWHVRRILLTAALAGAATATAIDPPSAPVEAATTTCGPLGTLQTFQLNDRCNYGLVDLSLVTNATVTDVLDGVGLFATMTRCTDQWLSSAAVLAMPDELLVTASDPEGLDAAVAEVSARLNGSVVGVTPLNPFAATLSLRGGTLDDGFLRQIVPTLQGQGFSTDLNYLEPVLPINSFRPADNPVPAVVPSVGRGGNGRVLVVDSPSDRTAATAGVKTMGPLVDYDVDGNGFVDEDHGHGVFVASLIKQAAPSARVVLAGVGNRRVPASERWSPMVFSDADVIAAIGEAYGLSATGVGSVFDVVNLSLGGAGCAGIGSRLALGRFLRDLADLSERTRGVRPVYVAAAGNDGADVKHFPAAWRDRPTILAAAAAVDAVNAPGAGDEIRAIQSDLAAGMLAVGSWFGGARDAYSNCGTWVNSTAAGAGTVGRYPSPPSHTGWARWSGTSFATARVSAALAGGEGLDDVVVGDGVGHC
jgi:Subtilase family